ncbi:MAG: L-aspartate oxidase [Phycisphaerales bacterium]|nr:MAG: L-aspartate oxidase [Phycisphaerales bacterium]
MAVLYDTRRYLTNFDSARIGHILTDVLVIGSGVAGVRAAIEAARHGDVILITKESLDESATSYAQGGIAGAMAGDDSIDNHAEDTVRVGVGLSHPDIVHTVVRDGLERINELVRWGARFDRDGDRIVLGQEGGHQRRRILHANGDQTGRELVRCLLARLNETPNVRVFECCFLIDLITLEGRCVGAVTFHEQYGHQLLWAGQTILAGGGGGRVYRETTNPQVATGDAYAVAFRAGARLRDMELVQFHPTTLYVAGSSRALISEAVRGEGAYLIDRGGDRFMFDYHPDAELAPRDVVSQAIRDNLAKTGGTCVYIDVRHLGQDWFARRFPHITRLCQEFDIDVGRDLIPVRPAAHYMIGGVAADSAARTSLEGLLCCGEAASAGLHGANRLPSNSLLEGLVFGAIAGQTAGARLRGRGQSVGPAKVKAENPISRSTRLDLSDIRNSLRSLMWRNVGIARSHELLTETIEIINFWGRFVLDKTFDDRDGWETQNMLTVGRLITAGALHRGESRGVHYRTDFPAEPDPSKPAYHVTQQRSGDRHVIQRDPLTG